MSCHNSEAAYASAEIASIIQSKQDLFFNGLGRKGEWSLFAGREGGSQWPLADGVINASNPLKKVNIAFEYKRSNEGIHGILTALGQSYAYLEKGYDASVMAFPSKYVSHTSPGEHIKRIIESTAPDIPIWLFTYKEPDLSATRPFKDKLECVRDIALSSCRKISRKKVRSSSNRVMTLWAHVREGMSHPDALFRYCQSVKIVSSFGERKEEYKLPEELRIAVKDIDANADIYNYLSYTSSDSLSDKAWRRVWFTSYFWEGLAPIYGSKSPYKVNDTSTKIRIDDYTNQKLFSGRTNSIKNKLVNQLNDGSISEIKAWKDYAKIVRRDAHSYKEVIDSGLNHLGFLNSNGELTDLGYKFVDACERNNSSLDPYPMEILRAAALQNGQYATLLHYIFKLSEERFDNDLYAFSSRSANGNNKFEKQDYLTWLRSIFVNELRIIQTSSLRANGSRPPLQAEIWFMNKLGFVRSNSRGDAAFRAGTGLCIDWPQVETSLQFFNSL